MANPGRPRKCAPEVEDLRSNIRQQDYRTAKSTLNHFGVDATDGEGRTALINAVIENKPDFIQFLLSDGANVNHQDRNGYTALHFAASVLKDDIAQILLNKGANPNLQDKHGNTPLWTAIFASRGEDISTVKTLLKHGANPDVVNNYGTSPRNLYEEHYRSSLSSLDSDNSKS